MTDKEVLMRVAARLRAEANELRIRMEYERIPPSQFAQAFITRSGAHWKGMT